MSNQDGTFRWEQQGGESAKLISAKGVECGEVMQVVDEFGAYIRIHVRRGEDCLCIGYFRQESKARQAVLRWWRRTSKQVRGLGL